MDYLSMHVCRCKKCKYKSMTLAIYIQKIFIRPIYMGLYNKAVTMTMNADTLFFYLDL